MPFAVRRRQIVEDEPAEDLRGQERGFGRAAKRCAGPVDAISFNPQRVRRTPLQANHAIRHGAHFNAQRRCRYGGIDRHLHRVGERPVPGPVHEGDLQAVCPFHEVGVEAEGAVAHQLLDLARGRTEIEELHRLDDRLRRAGHFHEGPVDDEAIARRGDLRHLRRRRQQNRDRPRCRGHVLEHVDDLGAHDMGAVRNRGGIPEGAEGGPRARHVFDKLVVHIERGALQARDVFRGNGKEAVTGHDGSVGQRNPIEREGSERRSRGIRLRHGGDGHDLGAVALVQISRYHREGIGQPVLEARQRDVR